MVDVAPSPLHNFRHVMGGNYRTARAHRRAKYWLIVHNEMAGEILSTVDLPEDEQQDEGHALVFFQRDAYQDAMAECAKLKGKVIVIPRTRIDPFSFRKIA